MRFCPAYPPLTAGKTTSYLSWIGRRLARKSVKTRVGATAAATSGRSSTTARVMPFTDDAKGGFDRANG